MPYRCDLKRIKLPILNIISDRDMEHGEHGEHGKRSMSFPFCSIQCTKTTRKMQRIYSEAPRCMKKIVMRFRSVTATCAVKLTLANEIVAAWSKRYGVNQRDFGSNLVTPRRSEQ